MAVVMVAGMGIWQQAMMTEMLARSGAGAEPGGMFAGRRIASGVMAGAFVAVMAWLAARLSSRDVRTEFSGRHRRAARRRNAAVTR